LPGTDYCKPILEQPSSVTWPRSASIAKARLLEEGVLAGRRQAHSAMRDPECGRKALRRNHGQAG